MPAPFEPTNHFGRVSVDRVLFEGSIVPRKQCPVVTVEDRELRLLCIGLDSKRRELRRGGKMGLRRSAHNQPELRDKAQDTIHRENASDSISPADRRQRRLDVERVK